MAAVMVGFSVGNGDCGSGSSGSSGSGGGRTVIKWAVMIRHWVIFVVSPAFLSLTSFIILPSKTDN